VNMLRFSLFQAIQRARRRAALREIARRAALDYWRAEIDRCDEQLATLDANDPERPEIEANRGLCVLRYAETV
jgi:hypothetical protein